MSNADALEQAERSLTVAVAESMGISPASTTAPSLSAVVTSDDYEGEDKFKFDAEFQSKVAALVARSTAFNNKTAGLVKPSYFDNAVEAKIVDIALNYFKDYKKSPDVVTLGKLVKDAVSRKLIRSDLVPDLRERVRALAAADISDTDYVAKEVASFARHSEMSNSILASVDLLEAGKYEEIEKRIKNALNTGLREEGTRYSYFKEAESRAKIRRDMVAGLIKPNGITTGIKVLDENLHHKGWGRRELHSLLGGAKVGKTTALLHFGKVAAFAGHNVVYFTLEVSPAIIGDRLDASITGYSMSELNLNLNDIQEQVTNYYESGKVGKFEIHEYATGTMTPSDIRKTLEMHKTEGTNFDMVIIDYADIMAPEYRTSDPIENSKSIYQDIRAIAQEYDCAVLTATQSNREGFKAATTKAEHTSEDFNKVRIVDLMISINRTEEERDKNEARLYFAASRNQKGAFTIRVEQDLDKMIFIKKVLGIE